MLEGGRQVVVRQVEARIQSQRCHALLDCAFPIEVRVPRHRGKRLVCLGQRALQFQRPPRMPLGTVPPFVQVGFRRKADVHLRARLCEPGVCKGIPAVHRKRPFECSGRRKRLFRCELREVGTPLQVRLKCERVLGPAAPGCTSGLECGGDAFGNRRLEADEIGCGNIDSTTPHGARRRGVQQLEPRPISSSGTAQGAREDVVDLQRPPHRPDVWRSLVVRSRGRYGTNSNRSSDRETGDDGIGQAEPEVFRRAVHIHDVEGDDRERGVGRQRTARRLEPATGTGKRRPAMAKTAAAASSARGPANRPRQAAAVLADAETAESSTPETKSTGAIKR